MSGAAGILKQRASTMIDFDPRFEIMPGTKARGGDRRWPMLILTRPFRARR